MEYYDEDTDEGDLNTIIINDRNTIMGILHAWEKDVDKSGYTQENRYITPYTQLAMIDIYFTKNDRYGDGQSTGKESKYASLPGRIDNPYVAFMLTDMDSNLIKYLREQGYTAPQS